MYVDMYVGLYVKPYSYARTHEIRARKVKIYLFVRMSSLIGLISVPSRSPIIWLM